MLHKENRHNEKYFPYFYRCADGYMGQRCEFKDLDGSYLREYRFSYYLLQDALSAS
jgi:hypothetical protein